MKTTRVLTSSVLLCLLGRTGSVQLGHPNTPEGNVKPYAAGCSIFVRLDRSPILPLPKLDRRRSYDAEELSLLQADYIKEMRDWIVEERAREDAHYAQYIQRCVR